MDSSSGESVLNLFMQMAEVFEDDEVKQLAMKADLLWRTPGIIKPDDWDELSFEEQKKRVEMVQTIMNEETKNDGP